MAGDGGYIMDAGAIIQNDARVENIRAMTDFTREYGVYSSGHSSLPARPPPARCAAPAGQPPAFLQGPGARSAGLCAPWEQERDSGRRSRATRPLVEQVWDEIDGLANMFIWQILLSLNPFSTRSKEP